MSSVNSIELISARSDSISKERDSMSVRADQGPLCPRQLGLTGLHFLRFFSFFLSVFVK